MIRILQQHAVHKGIDVYMECNLQRLPTDGGKIAGAFGSVYDAERFGVRLVASPRHADGLLVTGVVTRNMAQPLRNTFAAVPPPRVVTAAGHCARNRPPLPGGSATAGSAPPLAPAAP